MRARVSNRTQAGGANRTRALPIWFALPTLAEFDAARARAPPCERKSRDFAPMVPLHPETYSFRSEEAYYDQYASSLFGFTMKKSGWDCLRHYEILASGAVPYFFGLDALERLPLTMAPFPRALVREAMRLPGVPPEASLRRLVYSKSLSFNASARGSAWEAPALRIDHAVFDRPRFCALQRQLLAHTRASLTAATLARHVLDEASLAVGSLGTPRVLLVFPGPTRNRYDYQTLFLYHGLRALLGSSLSFWRGRNAVQYADRANGSVHSWWSKGYSYQGRLPLPRVYAECGEERADRMLHELLERRMAAGHFNLLIVANAANGCCDLRCYPDRAGARLAEYIARWPHAAVATVDGSDARGCHRGFHQVLGRVDVHFVRENAASNAAQPAGD